ncbi:MAG: ABC-2 family transporter protein [Actinomycetota bacterium]
MIPAPAPRSRVAAGARLWRLIGRAVVVAAARTAANRGELVTTVLFYLMVSTVLSQMWAAAAEASGGAVAGYSAAALVWYILTTEFAVNAIPIRLIEDIGDDIGDRRIELELLRPASVLSIRVAAAYGRVLPRLAAMLPAGLLLGWATAGRPPHLGALLLAVPAVLLAVLVNVLLQHAFAGLSFWLGESKSGWFLYQKLVFVLGGMLLPLEVLPARLATVAKALPFAAVAYAPGRLAAGHVEPWWLLVQGGWLVLTGAAAGLVFHHGLARLRGAGA